MLDTKKARKMGNMKENYLVDLLGLRKIVRMENWKTIKKALQLG